MNHGPRRWRTPEAPWARRRRTLAWVALALLVVSLLGSWGIDLARVLRGGASAWDLLGDAARPTVAGRGRDILEGFAQSAAMAWLATWIGGTVGVVAGFASAANISPSALRWLARGLVVAGRAMHEMILAIFFVALLGFGPLAGTATLALASAAFVGKLLSEAIEEVDPALIEASAALGHGFWARVVGVVLPAVAPRVAGLLLYRLDINLRESAIVGLVGAGGIGAVLTTALARYEWGVVSAILGLLIVLVLALEALASRVRSRWL